jgi:hypothetical protein
LTTPDTFIPPAIPAEELTVNVLLRVVVPDTVNALLKAVVPDTFRPPSTLSAFLALSVPDTVVVERTPRVLLSVVDPVAMKAP